MTGGQPDHEVLTAARRFLQAPALGNEAHATRISLIVETSRLPLSRVDRWERLLRRELWLAEEARRGPRGWLWNRLTRFVSWVDLCSGDGHTRERTLRAISDGAPNTFFLLLAVRRLNDWVPEVRAAACDQLPLIARRSNPAHVVDALWHTLHHCVSWSRLGEREHLVLSDVVSSESVAVALKDRILAAAAGPAASILGQAGRSPALDRWLPEIARNAVQPSVRARAYRSLLEGRVTWVAGRTWEWIDAKWCTRRFTPVFGERRVPSVPPVVATLQAAASDRAVAVRRVAGDSLIQLRDVLGAEATTLAQRLAHDPAPSVAERGRYVLAQRGQPGRA